MKNIWSLEPGEVNVTREIRDHLKELEVFFPAKDVGVDLIAVKNLSSPLENRRVVSMQVKESGEYYTKRGQKLGYKRGWFTISAKKFHEYIHRVDFYIFVWYRQVSGRKRPRYKTYFIIVPTYELAERIKHKKKGKKYHFYLSIRIGGDENTVLDTRGIALKNQDIEEKKEFRDYSKYLNNWDLIRKAV